MTQQASIILCPGQGAQAVGMGRAWYDTSAAARATFDEADALLADTLGGKLSELCFNGPADRLNMTDVSQPAIYTCSVACYRAMQDAGESITPAATAGLSLGEYTALHLAGAFDFAQGLQLVAVRGRYMQDAAEASRGSMVALIGADDAQAQQVCDIVVQAAPDEILVPANYNAPGQIVLSGHATACDRAVQVASDMGLRATALTVAGAFHSPLMQPAADKMAAALAMVDLKPCSVPVWSNVTAQPHDPKNMELLRERLVQQIVSPVKWAQSCSDIVGSDGFGADIAYHELAPGTVLRGLMRRIDRNVKVINHEQPQ
jgi:[acyl-carrier-protein] S-malonyltransferase